MNPGPFKKNETSWTSARVVVTHTRASVSQESESLIESVSLNPASFPFVMLCVGC